MMNSKNLNDSKKRKNDEFYTLLPDIEAELQHYKKRFRGKTIYCNCDNPEFSNFWKYFKIHFREFGNETPRSKLRGISPRLTSFVISLLRSKLRGIKPSLGLKNLSPHITILENLHISMYLTLEMMNQ